MNGFAWTLCTKKTAVCLTQTQTYKGRQTHTAGVWCHSSAAGQRVWSGWLPNRNSIQIRSKRKN